jgi:predicted RNA-binding protein with PUA-like domain
VPAQHWLMKSEPEVFSIDDLAQAPRQTTHWEGVRNYQARNSMRAMKRGDGVLFYHSNAEPPGIAGLAEIVREAYPDLSALDRKSDYFDPRATAEDARWSLVDLQWRETFTQVLPLEALRKHKALAQMVVLQKGSRLSVQPVTAAEWKAVVALARRGH